ncbi:DNA polymerase IV [Alkalicoccus urumqiensis]|uniref:DNA polymerase IV n=1 Tax=Alkalicoccus urumqiensis TaxID=1548213 RepID=A0A2P6MKC6_ALKUR|nr:DNA polymerase IV [Alkalicoccus urumqiensis]PRO66737.1 DNA polymerase IV [Alkalicoccus urumqiensis]
MAGRIVMHVDMNSFYASVESADDPALQGKPLAIAGNAKKRKGIVVTASYEARRKGVKPPQPLWEAKKTCPDLLVREPRFDRYREISRQMFQLLLEYTPLVEPVSIDEGYLDMTTAGIRAPDIAASIQKRIMEELKLPCSIGVAPNKFLAKTASDMKKPLGITVLRKRDTKTLLWPLPCREMHGIGGKTAEKLARHHLHTIGDIAAADPDFLERVFGVSGRRMYERAHGNDDRPVDPEAAEQFKSVGHSRTLPKDASATEDILPVLKEMAYSLEKRMKKKHVYASGVQLTIRYADWTTVQRSARLQEPSSGWEPFYQMGRLLWEDYWSGAPVRLIGITGIDLVERGQAQKQLNLFSYKEDQETYEKEKLLNELNRQLGEGAVRRGYFKDSGYQ